MQDEVVAVAPPVLLHQDGVRARGQRGAREDASGMAGRQCWRASPAATRPRTGRQGCRREHTASKRDRVAVHGRLVEGGHGEGRNDVFGERAPTGLMDGNVFGLRRWRVA